MKTYPNSKTKNEKQGRDPIVLFFSFLLIGASGYFLYLGFLSPTTETAPPAQQNSQDLLGRPDYQTQVNKHLKETYSEIKMKEATAHYENLQDAPRLKETPTSDYGSSSDPSNTIQFEGDPRISELPQLLGRDQAPEQANTVDPDYLIQKKLFEDEQAQRYNRAYKEAYAKKYIENALKKGWVVKINENFEIISVQPVSKKRLPSLFDNRQKGSKAK